MLGLTNEEQMYASLQNERPPSPPSPMSVSRIIILPKSEPVAVVVAKVVPKFSVNTVSNKFGRTWTPGTNSPSTVGHSAVFRRGGAGAVYGQSRRALLDPLPHAKGARSHAASGRYNTKRASMRRAAGPKRESAKLPPSTTTKKVRLVIYSMVSHF
jgi:hypothetical protein